MDLLLIRHAIAEDRDEWAQTGVTDDLRPLTKEGQKRMKKAARGLARIVPEIDLLASSPYTRAVQTAEILAKRYKVSAMVVVDELVPERPYDALLEWLKRVDDADVVAVVGHEPYLGGIASWLLTGHGNPLIELKKGGACLLRFNAAIDAGAAQLQWAVTPGQLRSIG